MSIQTHAHMYMHACMQVHRLCDQEMGDIRCQRMRHACSMHASACCIQCMHAGAPALRPGEGNAGLRRLLAAPRQERRREQESLQDEHVCGQGDSVTIIKGGSACDIKVLPQREDGTSMVMDHWGAVLACFRVCSRATTPEITYNNKQYKPNKGGTCNVDLPKRSTRVVGVKVTFLCVLGHISNGDQPGFCFMVLLVFRKLLYTWSLDAGSFFMT